MYNVVEILYTNITNICTIFLYCASNCLGPTDCYPEDSVTIFALNVNTTSTDKIIITGELSSRMLDMYIATPGDASAGPRSKWVEFLAS